MSPPHTHTHTLEEDPWLRYPGASWCLCQTLGCTSVEAGLLSRIGWTSLEYAPLQGLRIGTRWLQHHLQNQASGCPGTELNGRLEATHVLKEESRRRGVSEKRVHLIQRRETWQGRHSTFINPLYAKGEFICTIFKILFLPQSLMILALSLTCLLICQLHRAQHVHVHAHAHAYVHAHTHAHTRTHTLPPSPRQLGLQLCFSLHPTVRPGAQQRAICAGLLILDFSQ